ncbi:ATP-binding cassette domain-containing protein [Bifidobacterium sp. ESL0682]|uniref:ATP-binding cassette domain-containing protein n=1 Tax=Bifidobacterium sp. ESL0682 TaxID=2983212 RepID=UPI0023F6DB29|nr:ATP-binding cassette domain-containing protein [Bifidobacterium sp. ESL0682]WEV42102.1 ATP-binding cassette domain-containing protein [Bifidobacterium sp. ESL0682]
MSNNTDPKDEAMNSDTDNAKDAKETKDVNNAADENQAASTEVTNGAEETAAAVDYDVVFDDDDNALDFANLATKADADDSAEDDDADENPSAGTDEQASVLRSTQTASANNGNANEESETNEAENHKSVDADAETKADANTGTNANTDNKASAENGEDKSLPDTVAASNAKRVNETLGLAAEEEEELETHEAQSPIIDPATALSSRLDKETIAETDILLKPNPTFAFDHVTLTDHKSGRDVLDNIDWSFFAGSLYAIVGADDEQRRTLLAVASGFYRPDSGQVMAKSQSLLELETNEIRGHRIGLITQRYSMRDDLDALGNITFTMRASGRTFLKPIPEAARDVLKTVDFDEAATGVPAGELSPVNQRRLAIARAICCEATVIVADDPVGGLEQDDRDTILDLLSRLAHAQDPKRCIIVIVPGINVEAQANSNGETDSKADEPDYEDTADETGETDYEAKADKIYSF